MTPAYKIKTKKAALVCSLLFLVFGVTFISFRNYEGRFALQIFLLGILIVVVSAVLI